MTEYWYQTENGEIFTVIVSVVYFPQHLLLLMSLCVFVMNPDVLLTACLYLSTYSAALQGMVTYVPGFSLIASTRVLKSYLLLWTSKMIQHGTLKTLVLRAHLFRLSIFGFIDGIAAGPSCCTFSRLRFNKLGHSGAPRPLQSRGKYAWGRPDLSEWERRRVTSANKLILTTLALCEEAVRQGGVHFIEHPRDPREHPFAPMFDTSEFQASESRMGASRVIGDQCPFGACCRKQSEYSGTVSSIESIGLFYPGVSSDHHHEPLGSRLLEDGTFQSKNLARYPSLLCSAISTCFVESFHFMLKHGVGPSGQGIGETLVD